MIITIDGPSGTGKTTIAKEVAHRLNFDYFDTGATYRAITLFFLRLGVDLQNDTSVKEALLRFSFKTADMDNEKHYFLNNEDITAAIRSQEITEKVSAVSALPPVRTHVWKLQRDSAIEKNGVFEGRDMGTVVFPRADLKIFLTASPQIRASRRLNQYAGKDTLKGMSQEDVLNDLVRRDQLDSTRKLAPLKQASDAHLIDTSHLTIEEVIQEILSLAKGLSRAHPEGHQKPNKRKKGNFLYRLTIVLVRTFFKLFYRHRVYGLEHFYEGGALITSNHTSFYDPPMLSASWPEEVHFLARETLFRFPLFGRLIKALNAHPVKGSAKDIATFRTICSLLEEEKKVLLFPEGRRSQDNALAPFKPGIAFLMLKSKKAIIPAYLWGCFDVWPRTRKFPKLFGKTVCVFGSPLLYEEVASLDKKEAEKAILERLHTKILSLKTWLEEGAKDTPP